VYDAVAVLGRGAYDLVFTGIGALGWLPDIDRWGRLVADLLRPGGRLFLREGHPVLWSLADPRPDGAVVLEYPYFQQTEPMVWDEEGTYVTSDATFAHTVSHEWNHGLGEIVTALLEAGLVVTGLTEHDSVPWNARPVRWSRATASGGCATALSASRAPTPCRPANPNPALRQAQGEHSSDGVRPSNRPTKEELVRGNQLNREALRSPGPSVAKRLCDYANFRPRSIRSR
jgi:hypothetical protein